MHAQAPLRPFRTMSVILAALVLAACGQGKGPDSIPGTLVPPPEPCDSVSFESDCPQPDIVNFNGGATIVVDNPDKNDDNPSDRVARMQKFPDQVFGGTLLGLGEPIDFSQGESYKVKVWSPRAVAVSFKLEEQGNPAGGLTKEQDHPGGSAWEELCFDFTGQNVPGEVVALTIIFDNGTLGRADTDPENWTFYYDDITQVESCTASPGVSIIPDAALYATGADPDLVVPDDYEEITAFGSGSVIDLLYADDETFSPALSVFSGAGYGANVAQAGFTGFPAGFLTDYETVDFKVKGMPNFVIFVKLFDGVDALRLNLTSSEFSTEIGDGWFQVSIPVSRFSDAELGTGIVFESDNTAETQFRMLLTDVGFSGTGTRVPADAGIIPDVTLYDRGGEPDLEFGVDYTEISVFGSGADLEGNFRGDIDFRPAWAVTTGFGYGIWNAQLAYLGFAPGFASPYETLDFKVKGLSGNVIRLKFLNDPDPPYVDINVATSGYSTALGNDWHQVSVPITEFEGVATATGLLFETVAPPPAESFTYLLTDIGFSGQAPVDTITSVNFEGDPGSYSFDNFGGGVSTVIANPDQSGINTSGQVVQMTRTSESNFGGSTLALPAGVDWSQGDIFRMNVWSPRPVPVLFKIEGSPPAERSDDHEGGGSWQELCFDFTGENAGAPVTGISIFFDLGVTPGAADDPDNWTFYYDDVEQSSAPCAVPPPPEFTTITFDDPEVNYELFDFGGNASVITNDPAGGTNQVVQVVKSGTAELWAGTTVATLPGQAVPEIPLAAGNTQMSVRVFSPDAGIPVRLKIEDASDGAISVETEAVTTEANTWETLTFDFADEIGGTAAFNPTATYNKISIFFNFGTDGATAGLKTYYFDDIAVGAGVADHGPGTAALFTETATESVITVTSITNSAAFGGNNTVADPASTAIPAFEGDVVLSIDYQNTSSTFGGVVLGFDAVDLTAYDTLNFTIDTSGIAGFADLTIQIEPPGAGADGTKVLLSAYTPVATSGNWATYAIPLAGFPVTDLAAAVNLGFWNPVDANGLAFGTVYVDDVYFSTDAAPADHGLGTAAVFTETATESVITVTSITNSADFGGNNTVADPASTAIPAFEGDVVLSIDYQNTAAFFGGVVLNFGGVDLAAYDTLNLTIDTTGIAGFEDLTIQIEPPAAGAPGTTVLLSAYTPVATSGNWATYAIPLADFPSTTLSSVDNLGFWNPVDANGLAFGTLYVDDVYFSTEGSGGGGGIAGNIAVNGGFETGDFTGWQQFDGGAIQVITDINPASGTFAANLNIPVIGPGEGGVDNLIKNPNLQAGIISANASVTVSFDMRGTLFGAGGVVFAELFSELEGGGTSKAEILGGALTPLEAWTPYSFTTTLGPDVAGGVTLQLKVGCGAVEGCGADVYFDNVSIVVN